jgi:hypothetical protein
MDRTTTRGRAYKVRLKILLFSLYLLITGYPPILSDVTRGYTPPCHVGFRLFDAMRRNSPPRCIQFRLFDVVRRYTPPCRVELRLPHHSTMTTTPWTGQRREGGHTRYARNFFYFHYSDVARRYTPSSHWISICLFSLFRRGEKVYPLVTLDFHFRHDEEVYASLSH